MPWQVLIIPSQTRLIVSFRQSLFTVGLFTLRASSIYFCWVSIFVLYIPRAVVSHSYTCFTFKFNETENLSFSPQKLLWRRTRYICGNFTNGLVMQPLKIILNEQIYYRINPLSVLACICSFVEHWKLGRKMSNLLLRDIRVCPNLRSRKLRSTSTFACFKTLPR